MGTLQVVRHGRRMGIEVTLSILWHPISAPIDLRDQCERLVAPFWDGILLERIWGVASAIHVEILTRNDPQLDVHLDP